MTTGPSPSRLASIDALRGLTVLVMLFVNDIGAVRGTPHWLRHFEPAMGDGMTLVDVVFPTFLFLVGMSLPFALGRRRDRAEAVSTLLSHVGLRTLALLVIGVLMVNSEGLPFTGAALRWTLLMYGGVVLAWHQRHGKPLSPWITRMGFAILILAACLFRLPDGHGWMQLRPQWWGILGLIGWAYLLGALLYLPLRRRSAGLLGAMALCFLFSLADALGHPTFLEPFRTHLALGAALGTHGGIVLAGAFLGQQVSQPEATPRFRIQTALGLAAGLALAAFLLHSLAPLHRIFTFNKILGTPAWGLMGAACASALWVLTYVMADLRGVSLPVLSCMGRHALTVYIAAPVLVAGLGLLGWHLAGRDVYAGLSAHGALGLLRTLASLGTVVLVVRWQDRRGWSLKL